MNRNSAGGSDIKRPYGKVLLFTTTWLLHLLCSSPCCCLYLWLPSEPSLFGLLMWTKNQQFSSTPGLQRQTGTDEAWHRASWIQELPGPQPFPVRRQILLMLCNTRLMQSLIPKVVLEKQTRNNGLLC